MDDMELPAQCYACARFEGGGQCAAFPAGIPGPILRGEKDHRQRMYGDHGLRFVMANTADAQRSFSSWQAYFKEWTTGERGTGR